VVAVVLAAGGCTGGGGDGGETSGRPPTTGGNSAGDTGWGDTGGIGACSHDVAPSAEIGRSIGGGFTPYAPGQAVEVLVAPQGGFGVPVSVRTRGLLAGDGPSGTRWADVELSIGRGAANEGTFFDGGPLGCMGSDDGGLLSGLVAGFDPDVVQTNEDLLALDGAQATVRVVVRDEDGVTAEASQVVTLMVSG